MEHGEREIRMEQRLDPHARCEAMVVRLNAELGWRLMREEQERYASQIVRFLPEPCSDLQLRQTTLYYHLDHAQVEALRDANQFGHDDAWASWMAQVVRMLRRAGVAQADDRSLDSEDIAQVARADLARALHSFRYGSRFSTWAHQVVVNSAQRVIRDSQAGKRAGRPDSLENSAAFTVPAVDSDHPEMVAAGQELSALIRTVLSAHPDKRLPTIFQLWAEEDLSVVEVSKRVGLSAPRVRVLIQQIRQLLQEHPDIRNWRSDTDDVGND